MTGPEFRSRFQLGERLTEPPVVTHRATDGLGNFVLAHFLLGSPEVSQASLVQQLQEHRDASLRIRDRIREVSETDGVTVVVTDVLEGFSTFGEWLEEVGRDVPEGAQPEEEKTEEEPRTSGAYTQLFKASDLGFDAPGAPADPVPPARGQEVSAGEADSGRISSTPEAESSPPITEMPSRPEAGEPAAAGGDAEAAAAADGDEDGAAAAGGDAEAAAAAGGDGDADGAALAGGDEQEAAPAGGAEEGEREKKSPGSYTMLFGSGPAERGGPEPPAAESAGTERPEPPAAESEPGEGQFRDEAQFPTAAQPEPPPPAPGEEKKSPGAYTRIFRALGSEERPESSPPPPPDSTVKRPPAPEPPPPQGSPSREAGPPRGDSPPEWQRWKDTPGASGGHIPSDDYLSHLGGAGGASGPPSSPGSPPPPREPPAREPTPQAAPGPVFPEGGGPSGPGHYTMVREGLTPGSSPPPGRGRPGSAREAPEKAPGREAASMPSRRSRMMTIIGLVAIFVVIVALILVFALTG